MTRHAFVRAALAVLVATTAVAVPAGVSARTITSYEQRIVLDAAGAARVSVEIRRTADASDPLVVPADGHLMDVAASGEDGRTLPARVVERAGRQVLVIDAGAAALVRVTFTTDAVCEPVVREYDARRCSVRFQNVTGDVVQAYGATIVLPDDAAVSSVDDVVPAVSDSSVSLPYELSRDGGRYVIHLSAGSLTAAQESTIAFRVKARRQPWAVGFVLAALGLSYAIAFRHLVLSTAAARG